MTVYGEVVTCKSEHGCKVIPLEDQVTPNSWGCYVVEVLYMCLVGKECPV